MWKTLRAMLRIEPLAAVFIIALVAMLVIAMAISKIPG